MNIFKPKPYQKTAKKYLRKSVKQSWDNTHFQRDWSIQGLQKHIAHHFLTGHYSWKETCIKTQWKTVLDPGN